VLFQIPQRIERLHGRHDVEFQFLQLNDHGMIDVFLEQGELRVGAGTLGGPAHPA